jgi:hypothetical protein
LDNKSDFFFVTKYGKGLLPTNMYLVLCNECMHGSTWTSCPVTDPEYIKYGMLNWKLALNAPRVLHGQKLRPIKPAGVPPDLKTKAKKTPPNKKLKFSTNTAVKHSPLSNIENQPTKTGSLFNTQINCIYTVSENIIGLV